MDEELDHLKGKLKEKVGWITDDRKVEREGKREQVKTDVNSLLDDAGDAIQRRVDEASH